MSIRAFGTLYAWGANHLGQCGRGPGHDQLTPSAVPGLPPMQAVATNSAATLALDERGRVWSWGFDEGALLARPGASGGRPYWLPSALRALGHRNTVPGGNPGDEPAPATSSEPTPSPLLCYPPGVVEGLPPVVQIALGDENGLALDHDGRVWAWGRWNCTGRHPEPRSALPPPQATPLVIEGLPRIRQISIGARALVAYALDTEGCVWSWGNGWEGELGRGKRRFDEKPGTVEGLGPVRSVHAGTNDCMALLEDGTLWGWGNSEVGLGFRAPKRNTLRVLAPVRVDGVEKVVALWRGSGLAVFRTEDGRTCAMGQGIGLLDPMQAGQPPDRPLHRAELDACSHFGIGSDHGFALHGDGQALAFGRVASGALGNGDADPDALLAPIPIQLRGRPLAFAAQAHHSYALMSD
ncbi:RCC1 domain-containing protein [Archangium violaceum]|uniref:RCC1 domain-containing protein n=1 Tax=Archangium violaceum TaxID=83451 RepID=UPI0036DEC6FA